MATNTPDGEVKGIHDVQNELAAEYGERSYIPIVGVNYWSFRLMIGFGFLSLLLCFYALHLVRTGKLETKPLLLKVLSWSILLPIFANLFGWIFTELGRQPWLVYGLMTTEDGVSPAVPTWQVAISFVVFTLLYGAISYVGVWLLRKYAKSDPTHEATAEDVGKAMIY